MTRPVDLPTGSDNVFTALAPSAEWRFLILAQVCNFNTLRRHVGKARADRLMDDVAVEAARTLPLAAPPRVGRSVMEIDLLGASLAEADAALDALARAFESPLDLDGELHRVDLLAVAAAASVRAVDEVRLAEEAEEALNRAQVGRCRPVRDVSGSAQTFDRASFTRELTAAIAGDHVFLQYQPKMNLRRHEVGSAEALVRWRHPERGLVLPNDFVPFAEETGLIGSLTLWTLRRVIADQQTLRSDGHDLTMFVNISGQLLGDVEFVEEACALVRDGGARIGFEITETSMIRDPDCAVRHLERIAKAGIPIAIDDYGSGLSSLAYLKKLPATELKIDKMFVMELTSSHRDPLIVRSTIDLAHAMEMEVTAEGVETPAALALLTVMGCDQVQGFLLSRPLSLDAFRAFMASDAAHRSPAPGFSLDRNGSFWKAA